MTQEQEWEKAEAYIYQIPKFTKKNTLDHTRQWYARLGNPAGSAKIIHVAGTNGKGSVCNYLSRFLTADGMQVGMFVSPHLISMNERIVVNGEIIDKKCFLEEYRRLRKVIDETLVQGSREDLQPSGVLLYHPTFFEFLFLLAMLIFERKKTEIVILETGLGGRLDATNIFERVCLTVITEIGLDHMLYLGETKVLIASEKAGIIKPGAPLVFADKEREVTCVLTEKAGQMGVSWDAVGKEAAIIQNLRNKSIDFSYKSRYYDYITFTLPTNALYQVENAALALRGYEMLRGGAWDTEKIREVLAETVWAGRMQEILSDVYVDGAHNEDGICAFLDTVRHMSVDKKNILVFSVVQDKAYEKMIGLLASSGVFDRFVVVQMPEERCVSQSELRKIFSGYHGLDVSFANSVDSALAQSVESKQADERVYIAGSLYLAGYVLAALGRKLRDD
ncbi:MAG: bifunctional folylpolyglutamate synthase/dihydrofolate synthase [Lachnospiraceae bacterium]|nr:bifunctional folylpolyglutamate synthase/dihydrofolate synthase [Lachnospiraceae bacterium]